MKEEIIEWINSVQDKIYNYRFNESGQEVTEGLEKLFLYLTILPQERVLLLNDILTDILKAQELKDYLLLADLFEFKLKKFVLDN